MTADRKTPPAPRDDLFPAVWQAALVCGAGCLLSAEALQAWLSSQMLSSQFVSPATWVKLATWFNQKGAVPVDSSANIAFPLTLLVTTSFMAATMFIGSMLIRRCSGKNWLSALVHWMFYGGIWWCLLGMWDWMAIGLQMIGAESLVEFWGLVPAFWAAMCLAGWLTTFFLLGVVDKSANQQANAGVVRVWMMIGVYVVVFVTMNWRLYFNLLIPHGDSAMYEEHLWNIIHGKGFRSYLDQGLFLGEHIQVVHLGLLPLYLIWPSHLLLEFCESLALALGAFPVYWMTRRHTQSDAAGLAAAAAYLLYPPMQFLDIEIDLKTFRPEAFGIPILLLTLDQLDRRNLCGVLLGMIGCFTVKEDYAIVLAPLGVWIAATEVRRWKVEGGSDDGSRRAHWRWIAFGVLAAVGSVAYLYIATRVVMPWFRSGAEIHYAKYFSKFGETPEEIVRTMVTQPALLLGEFFRTSTVLYALMLLAPLAFVPLLSPGRLAVGLPLFGILCLNELARDPRHQFHAPLVAIVFWALAGALGRVPLWFPVRTPAVEQKYQNVRSDFQKLRQIGVIPGLFPHIKLTGEYVPQALPANEFYQSLKAKVIVHALWTSSLAMGLFFALHPFSLTFWDAGSEWHWRKLYGPSERARQFAKIADLIPQTARVASTDFVHPRYTHHERSYDYSGYRRKVSGYEVKVPDDTEYIVIDTQHRYSEVKSPKEIAEYRDLPDEWELLPDETGGYFVVLKRRP